MSSVIKIALATTGLGFRIRFAFSVLTILATMLLFGLLFLEMHQDLPFTLTNHFRSLAVQLASDIKPFVSEKFDSEKVSRFIYQVEKQIPTTDIFVLDEKGEIKACSSESAALVGFRDIFHSSIGATSPIIRVDKYAWNSVDGIFIGAPLLVEKKPGFLFVRIDSGNLRPTTSMLFDLGVIVVGSMWVIVLMIAAVPTSYLVSNRVIRPLQQVAQGLEAISRHDYSRRLSVSGSTEIEGHAKAYNQMAETVTSQLSALEDQDRLLRKFLGQISESLDEPLQHLVNELQAVGVATMDQETRREKILALLEHCERINFTLNHVFEVARRYGRPANSG